MHQVSLCSLCLDLVRPMCDVPPPGRLQNACSVAADACSLQLKLLGMNLPHVRQPALEIACADLAQNCCQSKPHYDALPVQS